MIEVKDTITLLKSEVERNVQMMNEIDIELEQNEKRKKDLLERKVCASFHIDKVSKVIDIIERDAKNEKPFNQIHTNLS